MTTAAYAHNGQSVSAEAFYAIACDPRRHVAVEACAGAGKTWMLVSRMVRALLADMHSDGSVQPQEILAITFTKKAAGEMRERLYGWLDAFSRADDQTLLQELTQRGVDVENISQTGHEPNKIGRKQLLNLYRSVLASGRPVQIRTFHSWFAALLQAAPVAALQQLGLPVNYELLEDDGPAKALVWRPFYNALLAAPELKADFEAVVLAHGRFQTEKALASALDKRGEFLLADNAGVIEDSVQHFTQQFPEFAGLLHPGEVLNEQTGESHHIRTLFLSAAKALGAAAAPTFAAKGIELQAAVASGNIDDALKALLTQEGAPRKFGDKIIGIAAVRLAQSAALLVAQAVLQADAYTYQQRMLGLSRLLLAEFSALKMARGWVDMNDVERAASLMLRDPVLSSWVQERLDARIRHLMIDEFQDTNPLQWQALSSWLESYSGAGGGRGAPSVFLVGDPKQSIYRFRRAEPQVFIAAQAFVRHALQGDLLACDHTRRNSAAVIGAVNSVMLDACEQDGYQGFRPHTSASVEAGSVLRLEPIARATSPPEAENEDAAGISVWRDSLTTPRELAEQTLHTQQAKQVAAWVAARLVARLGVADEDQSEVNQGEVNQVVVNQGEVNQGEVNQVVVNQHEVNQHDGNQPKPIAKQVVKASPLQPSNIMVLSRKRAGLLPMQAELRALNIAAQIGEKTQLIECCEVLDVVALLDVLVSPQHDLSMARALRSPLFNLSDDALVKLALAKAASGQSWFYLLLNNELLEPEFIGLGAQLAQYQRWVSVLPPHDALQAIYNAGDVLARFAAAAPAVARPGVLANLQALLHAALDVGGGRYATPYAFVRALKAGGLQAQVAVVTNAVRLLTIHGAKGLEADTVLLLDTDTPPRALDSMSVLIDWPAEAAAPQKFVFLTSESKPPACVKALLATEQAARQREELNALYVALSRARNTLVLSSITPHRAAPRSWWQRLHALATAVPAVPADPADPAATAHHQNEGGGTDGREMDHPAPADFTLAELPELPLSMRMFPSPPADGNIANAENTANIPNSDDSDSSRIGRAMHRLLEWGDVDNAALAQRAARQFALEAHQIASAQAMARRIRNGAAAWAWQDTAISWQGDEVELLVAGQLRRIDRLVQRKDAGHAGHWWVLDYKSHAQPQSQTDLLAQLRGYRNAVQLIHPDEVVKAAFLTSSGGVVEVT